MRHSSDLSNDLATELAAALDWWREAGLDHATGDDPVAWLAPETAPGEPAATPAPIAAATPRPAPPPAARIGGDPALWPRDLALWREWWLTEPSLDHGQVRDRVASRGPAEPDLLFLVPEPEAGDDAILLGGPQGRLLAGVAAALGVAAARTAVASVLVRPTPAADWQALADEGMGEVLRHHLELIRPRRVIVLGSGILSLTGNILPQNGANLPIINLDGASVPLLVAQSPSILLDRPGAKAALWQRLLEWQAADERRDADG